MKSSPALANLEAMVKATNKEANKRARIAVACALSNVDVSTAVVLDANEYEQVLILRAIGRKARAEFRGLDTGARIVVADKITAEQYSNSAALEATQERFGDVMTVRK